MSAEAIAAGLLTTVAAFLVNRRVSSRSKSEMRIWYGWTAALMIRFLGVAASSAWLAVLRSNPAKPEPAGFLLTVLAIVLAGLFADLVASLVKVVKMNKAGY